MNPKVVSVETLWYTQRCLKRAAQIPDLVEHARRGGRFDKGPLIELHLNEDGQIVINNGHHRVTAAWLAGRQYLYAEEFVLLLRDSYRARYGRVEGFIQRLPARTLDALQLTDDCLSGA